VRTRSVLTGRERRAIGLQGVQGPPSEPLPCARPVPAVDPGRPPLMHASQAAQGPSGTFLRRLARAASARGGPRAADAGSGCRAAVASGCRVSPASAPADASLYRRAGSLGVPGTWRAGVWPPCNECRAADAAQRMPRVTSLRASGRVPLPARGVSGRAWDLARRGLAAMQRMPRGGCGAADAACHRPPRQRTRPSIGARGLWACLGTWRAGALAAMQRMPRGGCGAADAACHRPPRQRTRPSIGARGLWACLGLGAPGFGRHATNAARRMRRCGCRVSSASAPADASLYRRAGSLGVPGTWRAGALAAMQRMPRCGCGAADAACHRPPRQRTRPCTGARGLWACLGLGVPRL
jgi:hypothetical protein